MACHGENGGARKNKVVTVMLGDDAQNPYICVRKIEVYTTTYYYHHNYYQYQYYCYYYCSKTTT
jgi:hypothetical protein